MHCRRNQSVDGRLYQRRRAVSSCRKAVRKGGLDFLHLNGYNYQTQQNNEVLWRWRRFRRERGTFLLLLASLRVSSVQPPSPPQRVTYLAPSPEPQRGGGERDGGQGEPFDKLSSIKKHRVFRLGAFLCIHGNESVCIAPGCTSLKHSSTLGGGCQPLTRVKRNLSSPRGFTNSVDVV